MKYVIIFLFFVLLFQACSVIREFGRKNLIFLTQKDVLSFAIYVGSSNILVCSLDFLIKFYQSVAFFFLHLMILKFLLINLDELQGLSSLRCCPNSSPILKKLSCLTMILLCLIDNSFGDAEKTRVSFFFFLAFVISPSFILSVILIKI